MDAAEKRTDEKFAVAKLLAADLSAGDLKLPSFPEIVIRIKETLEDENSSTETIVQLINAEPVLAARLLNISNSAAMRPSGDPITDLNTAVNRVGRKMVRSTAMSFAMTQLKSADHLGSVKTHLEALWTRSAHVAALCFVLARKCTKLNPDEAMFIGLMHGIGEMYILVRASEHEQLFASEADMLEIMHDWSSGIGSSIIANWGFPNYVADAVQHYRDMARELDGDADFTDVLTVAYLLFQFVTAEGGHELQLGNVAACDRMHIAASDLMAILAESEEQIRSLRRALGKGA